MCPQFLTETLPNCRRKVSRMRIRNAVLQSSGHNKMLARLNRRKNGDMEEPGTYHQVAMSLIPEAVHELQWCETWTGRFVFFRRPHRKMTPRDHPCRSVTCTRTYRTSQGSSVQIRNVPQKLSARYCPMDCPRNQKQRYTYIDVRIRGWIVRCNFW